jgi:magnesium transporter
MLRLFPESGSESGARPAWIDLCAAGAEEVEKARVLTGMRVPTREALSEIESSSRVFVENGVLYLSMPLITPVDDGATTLMPIGFVLTKEILLTVRFGGSSAFDEVAKTLSGQTEVLAEDVFARLLEAMVDRAADRLEHTGGELDALSKSAFHMDNKRKPAKASDALRAVLRNIGQTGDRLSQVRDTLLGLSRICGFIVETPRCDFSDGVIHRLKAVQTDIASLNSYVEHLTNKVQFLLDATLGFISIDQNDIVKVLTVVSVVGVPPVLVAGIYGMNFKDMPEYNWAFGYPYSLILMVVSAIVPILLFKWRKWM